MNIKIYSRSNQNTLLLYSAFIKHLKGFIIAFIVVIKVNEEKSGGNAEVKLTNKRQQTAKIYFMQMQDLVFSPGSKRGK